MHPESAPVGFRDRKFQQALFPVQQEALAQHDAVVLFHLVEYGLPGIAAADEQARGLAGLAFHLEGHKPVGLGIGQPFGAGVEEGEIADGGGFLLMVAAAELQLIGPGFPLGKFVDQQFRFPGQGEAELPDLFLLRPGFDLVLIAEGQFRK